MKIAIACDHAGYEYKEKLVAFLRQKGYEVKDFGTHSAESMDYPDTAHPMAAAVESGEFERGIALCGSGNGICMTVNKHQGIRGALCWTTEIAWLARLHNQRMLYPCPFYLLRRCSGYRRAFSVYRI